MKFLVLFQTARKIVIELEEFGRFYSDRPYTVVVDGKDYRKSQRVIETVDGLMPDTKYQIAVRSEENMSETITIRTDYEYVTLNVKEFGAKGDGEHDDTLAIQAATSCCPKNSRVLVPAGCYRVSSLFLKSYITLELAEGAVLSAYTDREKFAILPGMTESWDEKGEYNLGTWEGNPLNMFSAIINGIDVTDVVIAGKGVLDGNAGEDNWWHEFRTIIGAYRPRMIFLNRCRRVTVHGITTRNTPAWNIHPYFSEDLRFL